MGHFQTPLQDAHERSPEVLIEKTIQDGVDAGVGDQQPNHTEAEVSAFGNVDTGSQEDADEEDGEHARLEIGGSRERGTRHILT